MDLEAAIRELRTVDPETLVPEVSTQALDGLKFTACLPQDLAKRVLQMRMSDVPAERKVLEEPVRFVTAVEARDSVGKDAR